MDYTNVVTTMLSPTYDNMDAFKKYSSGFKTMQELKEKFYSDNKVNLDNYKGKYFYIKQDIFGNIRGRKNKSPFVKDMKVFFNTYEKVDNTNSHYRNVMSLYNEVVNDTKHEYVLTFGYVVMFMMEKGYINDTNVSCVRYSNTEIMEADQFVQVYPRTWKVINDRDTLNNFIETTHKVANTIQAGVIFDNYLINVFKDIFKTHWGTVPNKAFELTKLVSNANDDYSKHMWDFFTTHCNVSDLRTLVKIMGNLFYGNGKSRGFSRISCVKMLKGFNIPYTDMVGHIYVTTRIYDTLNKNRDKSNANVNVSIAKDFLDKPISNDISTDTITNTKNVITELATKNKVSDLESRVKTLETNMLPKESEIISSPADIDTGTNTENKDIVTLVNDNAEMITLSDMDKTDYESLYKAVSNEFIESKVLDNKADTDILYKFLVCIMNADIININNDK